MSDKFGTELAQQLGEKIQEVYPHFRVKSFVDNVASRVGSGRWAVFIADALHDDLPPDYPEVVKILLKSLGPEHPSEEGMFEEAYKLMPVAQFVVKYGGDHFDQAMEALKEITQRASVRDALREFLVRYPERTMAILHKWTQDESPHVRRLVSDTTRPRLPARKALSAFIDDPLPVLDLLERLKDDPSAVVRKSVAGNLSDILKDNPDIGYETLGRWHKNASKATSQIIRSALGYQIKQGDPQALGLLGYGNPKVTLRDLKIEPKAVRFEGKLVFSFTLQNDTEDSQRLNADYVIHYLTATGRTSPKVYKLNRLALKGGKEIGIQREHSFVPLLSRRFYAGRHRLEIQVNGKVLGAGDFELAVQ